MFENVDDTKTLTSRKAPKTPDRTVRYSDDVILEICARLSAGESLVSIEKDKSMPSRKTVFDWLKNRPDFRELYDRAKQESADALAEEILDIADNQVHRDMVDDNGNVVLGPNNQPIRVMDKDSLMHARIRIDTRKWLAGKLKPKKYGDKITQEHTGADGQQLQVIEYVVKHPSKAEAATLEADQDDNAPIDVPV